MAGQVAKGIRFTFPGGRNPASAPPASPSQSWSKGSEPGAVPLHLRRPPTSAEAPAPPGPSPGHLVLRTSPSTVRPSLLALWGSQHAISSRRHLLSVSPSVAAWRTDSGCGHRGGHELCPCSPALAPENSEASGAKLCHTSISQGACKRLTPGAPARRAEAALPAENRRH